MAGHPNSSPFGWGNLGKTLALGPSHAAIPKRELCNGANPAGFRGWKEVGRLLSCHLFVCLFVCLFNHTPSPRQETVRLDRAARTAGFRRAPKLGQESLASLQEPMGAVPGLGPSPPPRAFPDSARGREPTGAGGQAGTAAQGDAGVGRLARSIAAGNSGLALSVSAPGLPACLAPAPGSHFRMVTQLAGYSEVWTETRNLPGRPAPPSRPRAGRGLRAALLRPPRGAWTPREPHRAPEPGLKARCESSPC